MRICLVYDCLFPWTVGGAERRMRGLAEELVGEGHAVTYLTRRQWPLDDPPDVPGVAVVAVSRDEPLYGKDGNRMLGEPVRFGVGVLRHLLRHGREYDVVHTVSFPYFSLLAAGAARRRGRYHLVCDWYEVWSADYWKDYVGGPRALIARAVQRACARIPQIAFVFSGLHARRLIGEGLTGAPEIVWAEWASEAQAALRAAPQPGVDPPRDPPRVVFAGRFIAEKQAPRAVEAIAVAGGRVAGLTGVIFGDGPEAGEVRATIDRVGGQGVITAPGFVPEAVLDDAMRSALCLLAPTRREGYGLVVIEAASLGVPIVVAAGPDNAAVELVVDGVNGFVCIDDSAEALADAIVRVHEAGSALRQTTRAWYRAHMERVAAQDPFAAILAAYRGDAVPTSPPPRAGTARS